MFKLTEKQQEVLNFIKDFIEQNDIPPSRMDIVKHFNFTSRNAAQTHLQALAKKQMINLLPKTARGIQVIQRELL